MGYYVVGHGGSGDHGSEDRVRGLCRLLPEQPEIHSTRMEEDWHYGLGHIAGLYRRSPGSVENRLLPGDVVLSTCPLALRRRGVKTVLLGVAEPLTRRKVRELSHYDTILVTDKLTETALRTAGLEKKICLAPDPIFLVDRHIRPLGGAFRQDTIGLCLSPGVFRFERQNGLLYRSYVRLMSYILEHTSFQIALIPYCAQSRCSDCLLQRALELEFESSGRILRREDGDCQALRGDISMCRCCVGTAGAMAAWSCGVPALCIGASTRAMGLGEELFGDCSQAVVSVASLKEEGDLTRYFSRFLRREDRHRRRLMQELPQRRRQAADIVKIEE